MTLVSLLAKKKRFAFGPTNGEEGETRKENHFKKEKVVIYQPTRRAGRIDTWTVWNQEGRKE